jgi:hypothetical protein
MLPALAVTRNDSQGKRLIGNQNAPLVSISSAEPNSPSCIQYLFGTLNIVIAILFCILYIPPTSVNALHECRREALLTFLGRDQGIFLGSNCSGGRVCRERGYCRHIQPQKGVVNSVTEVNFFTSEHSVSANKAGDCRNMPGRCSKRGLLFWVLVLHHSPLEFSTIRCVVIVFIIAVLLCTDKLLPASEHPSLAVG